MSLPRPEEVRPWPDAYGKNSCLTTRIILIARAGNGAKAMLALRPDRVAMQDATAQMAVLQFMQANKKKQRCRARFTVITLIRAEMGSQRTFFGRSMRTRSSIIFLPLPRRSMASALEAGCRDHSPSCARELRISRLFDYRNRFAYAEWRGLGIEGWRSVSVGRMPVKLWLVSPGKSCIRN